MLGSAAVVIVVMFTRAVPAQSSAVCARVSQPPYPLCQVDVQPQIQRSGSDVIFPEMARDAGLSGAVRALFLVDTLGRIQFRSLGTVGESGNVLFDNAVKSAIARRYYSAGVLSRVKVQTEIEELFVFSSGPFKGSPFKGSRVDPIPITHDTLPDGTRRTSVGAPPWDALAGMNLTIDDVLR